MYHQTVDELCRGINSPTLPFQGNKHEIVAEIVALVLVHGQSPLVAPFVLYQAFGSMHPRPDQRMIEAPGDLQAALWQTG
jgi:hypothetical protein